MKLADSFPNLKIRDVAQLCLPSLPKPRFPKENLIYHGACHCEWADVHKIKGQKRLVQALQDYSGAEIEVSKGCCGESGMGALTSPKIYNVLRDRKRNNLADLFASGNEAPIAVGCPSCKIGMGRTLLSMHEKRPVLHIAEWLAGQLDGEDRRQSFRKRINETKGAIRVIQPIGASTESSSSQEEKSAVGTED